MCGERAHTIILGYRQVGGVLSRSDAAAISSLIGAKRPVAAISLFEAQSHIVGRRTKVIMRICIMEVKLNIDVKTK